MSGKHLGHLRVVVSRIVGNAFKGIDAAEPHIERRIAKLVDGSREALGDLAGLV